MIEMWLNNSDIVSDLNKSMYNDDKSLTKKQWEISRDEYLKMNKNYHLMM